MSRRREANRAEAIVKGVGAMLMLLMLLSVTGVLPQLLHGKDPREMIGTLLLLIAGFAMLAGFVAVVGLIVWVKVRNRKR